MSVYFLIYYPEDDPEVDLGPTIPEPRQMVIADNEDDACLRLMEQQSDLKIGWRRPSENEDPPTHYSHRHWTSYDRLSRTEKIEVAKNVVTGRSGHWRVQFQHVPLRDFNYQNLFHSD